MEAIDFTRLGENARHHAKRGAVRIAAAVRLTVGVFSIGGSVATQGGLLFIGGTTDQYFRAIDASNGEILWEYLLSAGGNATPMTYFGKDGRQYVVIAAGGHGGVQSRNGDQVIAFALK